MSRLAPFVAAGRHPRSRLMMRRGGRQAIFAAFAFVAIACGNASPTPAAVTPSSAAPPSLNIANGTSLDISLLVNGGKIGDYPPGSGAKQISPASLPPLPWEVQGTTSTHRVLISMHVVIGDVQSQSSGGATLHTGDVARVDLSCGRLTIWAGDSQPSGPMVSPVGSPGDCVP